ncbi:MAG: hypothetical protein OMM_08787 [Candidatus Magnetoglobus multicellularis str. Araruama]|uniref:Type II toxin-antitoxin system RelE/ParE family toxin n=1 Tax=Candidatus Magnetoglobus multicellularis str. Araruama TaxID=890399 RepID=A0A1V1P6F9_9BACT|nr:MAG: hypothetical protein OMM_08787 [Candidatus Magnetoglobus multicellularis str. Araruama]
MNIKDILILKEAVVDLNDGKQFYNTNQKGVGTYFWNTLISDIESLVIYAGVHRKEYGFYRMLSKRFPYVIYYDLINDIAYVVAVLPLKRNPLWIRDKIKARKPLI